MREEENVVMRRRKELLFCVEDKHVDQPKIAMAMPPRLTQVTGFLRSRRETEITAILLVTLATAYVREVTSLRRVKARMFWSQWRPPSTMRRRPISVLSSGMTLTASAKSQTGKNMTDAIRPS